MQRLECFLIAVQPQLQTGRAIENDKECIETNGANGYQLDQRLKGDSNDQAFMFLAGRNVPCTEENGE